MKVKLSAYLNYYETDSDFDTYGVKKLMEKKQFLILMIDKRHKDRFSK